MSKVSGIFEKFENLDKIPIDDISRGLVPQPPHLIENLLANLLLYPQVAAIKKEDIDIELSILREVIRRSPSNYYSAKEKKIFIPAEFMTRFPDLNKLALAFVDGLSPKGIAQIVLGKREIVGSFIKIEFNQDKDNFEMLVLEKKYSFNKGGLAIIPCNHHCHITFKSDIGKIDNKSEATLEILGGRLGLVVDGRTGEL